MLYPEIIKIIHAFSYANMSEERKLILEPLIIYIQKKRKAKEQIRLNFICTHNSRRSHLAQIWAQTMASYYEFEGIFCYSGGTEATAFYPKIAETLTSQGFRIKKLSSDLNPVYMVKFAENEMPLVCFSKVYDHICNPTRNFAAIMVCDHADVGCPYVIGAEERVPIKYEDPKLFDATNLQKSKYSERSFEIAQELGWVFSQIGHFSKSV